MGDLDYRKLLDAFGDAIVIGDRSGSIVYVNPAVGKLLGWTREELVGRPLTQLIPHKLRSRHTAGFNRARSTRQHRVLGQTLRVPVLRPNGTERVLEMVLSGFRGGAGEELFIASFRASGASHPAPGDTGYLHGLAAVARRLPMGEDPRALIGQLEVLTSAHLGACGMRLWLSEGASELRLVNKRPIPELHEPETGVITIAGHATLAVAARSGQITLAKNGDGNSDWRDQRGIAVSAAVPLLKEGSTIGVLHFLGGDSWSENLAEALSLLAGFVVLSLTENQRRAQEPRNRAAVELGEAMAELSGRIGSLQPGDDATALYEDLVKWGIRLTGAGEGSLVVSDDLAGDSVILACAGYKKSIAGMRVPQGLGVTALVRKSGQPVIVSDYQQLDNALPGIRQRGARSAVAVPVSRAGRVAGVLALGTRARDKQFTEADIRNVQVLAALAAFALNPPREPPLQVPLEGLIS